MAFALYSLAFVLFTAGLLQHCYANGVGIVAAMHQAPKVWRRYRRFRICAWILITSGLTVALMTHHVWR